MNKKNLLLILTLLLSLFLFGCEKTDIDDDDDPVVTLENITFKDNQTMFQFDLESFRLNDIELQLNYSDGTKKMVKVDKSMISDTDFKTLLTTGQYFIKINYMDSQLEALIEMSSTLGSQGRLSDITVYTLSHQAGGKTIYDVYSTGLKNYYSFQLVINHAFIVNEVTLEEVITGISSYKVDEDSIKVLYSFGEAVSGDQHLFRIVIDSLSNAPLSFNDLESLFLGFQNKEVIEITDVRFFAR
jgi:hypothetical protein